MITEPRRNPRKSPPPAGPGDHATASTAPAVPSAPPAGTTPAFPALKRARAAVLAALAVILKVLKAAAPPAAVFAAAALLYPVFRPEGPVAWFIVPALFGALWMPIRTENPALGRTLWAVGAVSCALLFFFIFVYGVSIPAEVYGRWFASPETRAGSPPSLLLWSSLVFIGVLVLPLVRQAGVGAALAVFAAAAGTVFIILGRNPVLSALLTGAVLAAVLVRLRGYPVRAVIGWAAAAAAVFAVIWAAPPAGPAERKTVDQAVVEFLDETFEEFPLVLDLPGRGVRQISDDFGSARGLSPRTVFALEDPSKRSGAYYFETRRSSALGPEGWLYTRSSPSASADAARETHPDDRVGVLFAEDWWRTIPGPLTFAGEVYLPDPAAESPEPPIAAGTEIAYLRTDPAESAGIADPADGPAGSRAVFPTTPAEIAELAASAEGLSFSEQTSILLAHLETEFRYSLNSEPVQPNRHPLADFLENRRGYCLHFASFGALYYRELGYPVHLIEGFAGYLFAGSAQARGLDSHSWVEVETGTGAPVVVDPTPRIRFDQDIPYDYELDPDTLRYLEQLAGLGPASERVGAVSSEPLSIGPAGFAALAAVAAGLAIGFSVFFFRPSRRWRRLVPRGGAAPLPFEQIERSAGTEAARLLYLPSLMAWFGYDEKPRWTRLIRDLKELRKRSD